MGGMAGVAGLPAALEINECDTKAVPKEPAGVLANPGDCRTFEIDRRLTSALYDAGRSALGMPGSVDTFKTMLAHAGLALVLA